jgi:hypothetical protein
MSTAAGDHHKAEALSRFDPTVESKGPPHLGRRRKLRLECSRLCLTFGKVVSLKKLGIYVCKFWMCYDGKLEVEGKLGVN